MFTVFTKNSQNDRLYIPAADKKQNVAAQRMWDVSDLKQRLIEVWAQSKQSVTADVTISVSVSAFVSRENSLNIHCLTVVK